MLKQMNIDKENLSGNGQGTFKRKWDDDDNEHSNSGEDEKNDYCDLFWVNTTSIVTLKR